MANNENPDEMLPNVDKMSIGLFILHIKGSQAIRTVSAYSNSVESDLGCTSRIYFDKVMLTLHNVTLTSQKPCQHNNKCD